MQRGLGAALAAVAAGWPCRDDAALAGARPCFDPRGHPAQQERRPVDAVALRIAIAGKAGGTIECRPEKFARDKAILGGQVLIRCPARCENGALREASERAGEN